MTLLKMKKSNTEYSTSKACSVNENGEREREREREVFDDE
jgi:hypothetical protein